MPSVARKLCSLLARVLPSNALRIACQRACGARIGAHVYLGYEVLIDPACPELIEIEDGARIGHGVIILGHNRPADVWLEHLGEQRAPVRIGRQAAVYAGAIIMPGVRVGQCAIVREGAVVDREVPDGTVVAGVPARIVEALPLHRLRRAAESPRTEPMPTAKR